MASPLAHTVEQHLIESQRCNVTDPIVVVDKRGAVGDHGVVDRMPITVEVLCDFVDGASVFADLERHSPTGSVRQRHRRAAMRGSRSVHDPAGHDRFG